MNKKVVVMECQDCGYKDLIPSDIVQDGMMCPGCGSGLYIDVDRGTKEEMLKEHTSNISKKDSILKMRYKTNSLELNFEGSVEDGMKILRQLEPPMFIAEFDEGIKGGDITVVNKFYSNPMKTKDVLEKFSEVVRRTK
jgi:hypothetical protein